MWLIGIGVAAAAPELCNGVDDDDDGQVDEIPLAHGTDLDGDGYGGASAAVLTAAGCPPPPGAVADLSDCDDGDGATFPGAPERCNARDDDCDGEVDEGAPCACDVAVDAGSVWHRCDHDLLDWWSAGAACAGIGGHLASIDGQPAQDAAAALLTPFETDFWLGGTDLAVEGTWTWSDGTPFGFDAWRTGQPDDGGTSYPEEDCTEMVHTGEWNDRVCEIPLPYLCERECDAVFHPDADGDGLGDGSAPVVACAPPAGHVANGADCDDGDPALPAALHPDADGDGSASEVPVATCDGAPAPGGDCDDGDETVHPGAADPAGDGADSDCDGADGPPPTTTGGPPPVGTGTTGTTSPGTPPSGGGAPPSPAGDSDGDGVVDGAEPPGGAGNAGGAGMAEPPEAALGLGCGCSGSGAPAWGAGWLAALVAAAVRRRGGAR